MGSGASSAGSVEKQMAAVSDLLLVEPKVKPPLDAGFAPVVLAKREYRKAAENCKESVSWALVRSDGCARGDLKVFPQDDKRYQASIILAGVMIQESIWRCGASSLKLAGPADICEQLKKAFSPGGTYAFEADVMPKANGTPGEPFGVEIVGR